MGRRRAGEGRVALAAGPQQPRLTYDLWQGAAFQVQQHGPRLQAGAELKEAVQGQCGHVGLAPALASFLHLFFKLYPPAEVRMGLDRAFALRRSPQLGLFRRGMPACRSRSAHCGGTGPLLTGGGSPGDSSLTPPDVPMLRACSGHRGSRE